MENKKAYGITDEHGTYWRTIANNGALYGKPVIPLEKCRKVG